MANTLPANMPDKGVRVLSLGNALLSGSVLSYSHALSQMVVAPEHFLSCSSSKG
jgi:hypothetical protein